MQKEIPSNYNPDEQLGLLKTECGKISKEIYKTYSSYLQIIRLFLPNAVRQAVFLLITDQEKDLSEGSSVTSRNLCLEKIDNLVSNCLALLTVEHLMHLAEQLEKENNKKIRQNQEYILNALNSKNGDSNDVSFDRHESIRLSSQLPLDDPSLADISYFNNSFGLEGNLSLDDYIVEDQNALEGDNLDSKDNSSKLNNLKQEKKQTNELDLIGIERFGIENLKKLFSMKGVSSSNSNIGNIKKNDNEKINLKTKSIDNSNNKNFLPDKPLSLINWITSMDAALIRNLRNLSNSINVELLREGLINNLMPLTLLDAVINGQISCLDAPSNLVRLNVPINSSVSEEGIDIDCLLLRPSELEFDHPSLRKCRKLIKQQRNTLVKRLAQYRYWQSRSLANEVSKGWLQSPLESNKPSTDKI